MRFYIFNNAIPAQHGMSGSDRRALECSQQFTKRGYQVRLITE
jgi:hypothetical protein